MKVVFALLALLSLSSPTLYAEQVESIAGTLKALISNTDTESLTVTGSINAIDIDFINNQLSNLTYLDLSGATIESTGEGAIQVSPANTLPAYSFMGSGIKTLILPANLKTLAEGCLAASSITGLTIPESVDSLSKAICNSCKALTAVKLPSATRHVPDLAFKGCSALSSVTLSSATESIGNQSFYGCTSLESISLPEAISTIGNEAFNGCTQLNNVNFTTQLKHIGETAFSNTAITSADLSGCKNLTFLGSWAFSQCLSLVDASLPVSLTAVGEGIFFNCTSLETVSLPATLTELTPYMLKNASLTSADDILTDATQSVGRYALYGNDRLTFIKLPATVDRIDDKAMAHMSSLSQLDATGLTALPALGEDVFDGTADSDVTLLTSAAMAAEFEAAPQWQEFNIVIDEPSHTETPAIDTTTNNVRIRHIDNILYIESPRAIETVTLYDLQSRIVAQTAAYGNTIASISTAGITSSHIVIARILTSSDSAYSFKIKL